jgi:capsular exopolysaccharide synthesis family protein
MARGKPVSKIQTSIQKAIDKTKGGRPADKKKHRRPDFKSKTGGKETGSGAFRLFQVAETDHEQMEQNRLVSEVEDRSAIGAFKVLRTRVLQRMRSNNWRTLIVTSAGAGEGKSLTASNLALSLSRDVNQSVLLVDLDLQRSRIAEYFGFAKDLQSGISDYLIGNSEISDIVYSPSDVPRISIIPNVVTVEDSSDLLSGPRMKELLEWIYQQSERTIVIFDMPPVLVGDDVLAFSTEIDAVLLVATQGKTDRASLEKTVELLADMNLIGVVLNKCSESRKEDAYAYY